MFDSRGETIVVAGAASGLGIAIRRILGERGTHLVWFDNDGSRLDSFPGCLDFPHQCLTADITSEKDNRRVLDCALDGWRRGQSNQCGRATAHRPQPNPNRNRNSAVVSASS